MTREKMVIRDMLAGEDVPEPRETPVRGLLFFIKESSGVYTQS